jgi:hypothetical protein
MGAKNRDMPRSAGGVPSSVLFRLLSNVGSAAPSHAGGHGGKFPPSNHGAGRVACSATRLVCRSDVVVRSAVIYGQDPQSIFARHCHCRVPQEIVPGGAQPSRTFLARRYASEGGGCGDTACIHAGFSMFCNCYIDNASSGLPTCQSISLIIPPPHRRSPLFGRKNGLGGRKSKEKRTKKRRARIKGSSPPFTC